MIKWKVTRDAPLSRYAHGPVREASLFHARINNQQVRVLVFDDHRKTPWIWRQSKGYWIREINPARAKGLITIVRAARQAPGFVIQPYDDPRDARVPWQSIEGGPKKQWRQRKPEHTKRSASVKVLVAREQSGN